jgi:ferredoxin/flavodoxin
MHKSYRTLIYFHTASGNTGWITYHLARTLSERDIEVTVRNIACQPETRDAGDYDLIGFGCPVMGFRPTFSMTDFMSRLPEHQEKHAFIYLTCAGISASSLWTLSQLLSKKSFVVIAAKKFCGEVSWPVARMPGLIPNRGRPDARDFPSIQQFCEVLYEALTRLDEKRPAIPLAVPFAFLNPFSYMGRANKSPYLRSIMGTKKVTASRCTRCGMCQKYCGSNAILLNPYPQFSSACTGCWGCYNICPESAISTFIGIRGRYTARTEYLDRMPMINKNESSA